MLSRSLGLHTDDDTAFQTGSVWTYFSGIKPLASYRGWPGKAQFPRDHYTEHVCFREGWLWYIPIVSWQSAPTANLGRIYERVLQARLLPSREELEETYSCPTENIVGSSTSSSCSMNFSPSCVCSTQACSSSASNVNPRRAPPDAEVGA